MIDAVVIGFICWFFGILLGFWVGFDMGNDYGMDTAFKIIGERLIEEMNKDLEEMNKDLEEWDKS